MSETAPLSSLSSVMRSALFGSFAYSPRCGKPYAPIDIEPGWTDKNLIIVECPQLAKVPLFDENGVRGNGSIRINTRVAAQFLAFWRDVEAAGLLSRVLTWDGCFCARFTASGSSLSNHAWGTAFDINAEWNGYGHEPARVGQKGCVRELVPIAHKHGLFWGGDFESHKDGMHFEFSKIVRE